MEEEDDSSKVGRGNNGVGGDQLQKQKCFRAWKKGLKIIN